MYKLLFIILLLFSSEYLVLSLKCYRSPIPYFLSYSITIDNLFTIIWLRNPENSIIVFGYDSISNKINNILNDSILANVQYEKEGEILNIRLSHYIYFNCQSTNKCNHGTNIKINCNKRIFSIFNSIKFII